MNSDEIEFETYLMLQLKEDIEKITKKTENKLKEKVQKNLYDEFSLENYTRTNELKEAITSNCDAIGGKAYFDPSKLQHKSSDGEVRKLVPQFTNDGHKDSTGIDNLYHNYSGRKFVEDTIAEMESNSDYNIFKFFKIVD